MQVSIIKTRIPPRQILLRLITENGIVTWTPQFLLEDEFRAEFSIKRFNADELKMPGSNKKRDENGASLMSEKSQTALKVPESSLPKHN